MSGYIFLELGVATAAHRALLWGQGQLSFLALENRGPLVLFFVFLSRIVRSNSGGKNFIREISKAVVMNESDAQRII